MYSLTVALVFSIPITISKCYVTLDITKQLHPVHGLYVKPSSDGTTGDLYVAATEDSGSKHQWLTDQPVNFLTAASKIKSKSVPVSFSSSLTKSSSPNDETITSKKRTVIKSPGMKYAYALPVPGAETPYPYPMRAKPLEEFRTPCSNSFPPQPYSPYNYFYPYMMSALANALNGMKENDVSEEVQDLAPHSPPYWPHPYTYPYQYVMVDPNAWAQAQTNVSPPSSTTASSAETA